MRGATMLDVFDFAAQQSPNRLNRCFEVRCEDCAETPWSSGALRKRGLTAAEARAFLVVHQGHRCSYTRRIEIGEE